jgi:hypothetical protein
MSSNIDTLIAQYRDSSTTNKTEIIRQINTINISIINATNNKPPISESDYKFIQKIKNHWANNQNIIY